MGGVSDDEEGPVEIIGTEAERDILYEQACDRVERLLLSALAPEVTVGEGAPLIASMAVTAVLRRLRVMSARQMAVLLGEEANRHERHVIHEPPRYAVGAQGSGK